MKNSLVWVLLIATVLWLGVEFAADRFGPWIYYLAGVVLLGILLWTQRQIKEQKGIIALLSEACDPEAFLEAYGKEMDKVKDPGNLDLMRINQAAGVCYGGNFDKALKILRGIDFESLKGSHKAHYLNNHVSVLLLAGRDQEALRTAERNAQWLEMKVHNAELETALQGTRGGLAFARGNLAEARSCFEMLLKKTPAPLIEGVAHLYLGRIAVAEGRGEQADTHFSEARRLGGKTVIPRLAEKEALRR